MTDASAAQESLEAFLKDEIIRMYQDVAENPEAEYHCYHGREARISFTDIVSAKQLSQSIVNDPKLWAS